MIINNLHRTITSLLKKRYTVEYYRENNYYICLSFYHLNSVYNGLVYISKENGAINIDFQYHHENKTVYKRLKTLGDYVYRLYKLNQLDTATNILANYKPLAMEIYNKHYSLFSQEV